MSVSQHPIALRIEQAVGGQAALLATVMFLPLIDGVFAALVLAGALDSIAGVVMVGLLIFAGSATVAVIVAEFDGSPTECAKIVLLVGIPLIILSAAVAALAPTIASVIDLAIFERFAALVILAIAAQTASAKIGQYLPKPAVIIGLGLIASINPSGAEFALAPEVDLIIKGAAAAGIGVAFSLLLALGGPQLRSSVDLDRFRFGSAVSLGLLPLSILGAPFGEYAPLAVLVMSAVFAYNPSENTVEASDKEVEEGYAQFEREDEAERAPWL